MIPYSIEAYNLLHNGAVALAQVEANGIRIDERYLKKAIRRTKRKIERLERELAESKVMKLWRKTFKHKTKLDSTKQLGEILFNKMDHECPALTPTGRPKTDEATLAMVKEPFVEKYLEIKKLRKALNTYLRGIQRQVINGLLRPHFNLHFVRTYRSSSEAPNFQNIPVRNPIIKKLIRRAFIAREGNHLVEIDYGGIEVKIAACYHQDPTMMTYIHDPTTDMHRDMAMECYKLPEDEITKDIRYCGKNKFVFPVFYGDWYKDCARYLWDAIDEMKLETASGIPLKQHLKKKGIRKRGDCDPRERGAQKGTFEKHIQEVEQRFWGERFSVYSQWKKDWFAAYEEQGWFKTKTGFICQGFMKRNEVINYPVQGSAFHCLLWSLIQLVTRELKRLKMKTLIVGQIHDSIVADVPAEELDEFLALVHRVMVVRLQRRWKWINVPLEIEAEVAPVGGSWYDKEEMKIDV